ncbi:MAG: hypothetical protein KGQ70_07455, partial [Alphaproteobacteria bacterium]|nr:hypothetical protein [Alphaproteobacteria bacterium]
LVECGILAIAAVAERHGALKPEDVKSGGDTASAPQEETAAAPPPTAPMPAGARRPPPVTESAAAAQILGGPLSWAEIIGGGEPSTAENAPAPTPAKAPDQKQGISWESAMGLASPPSPAAAERTSFAPDNGQPEEAPSDDMPAALSWGDIIGSGEQSGDKQQ